MKNSFVALFIFLIAGSAFGKTVTTDCALTWDYETPLPETVDGFRVYVDGSQVWEGVPLIAPCADLGLSNGRHSAYVTAYNAADESGPSNIIEFVFVTSGPANAPANLLIIKQ